MYWKWDQGLPSLMPLNQMQLDPILLTSGWDTNKIAIRQRDVTESHKTFGVYMTPKGSESAQVEYLYEKSCRLSNLALSSNFSYIETFLAYRTIWYPAVAYSLGRTTMIPKQLRSIQRSATQSFLAKMGMNRNFP